MPLNCTMFIASYIMKSISVFGNNRSIGEIYTVLFLRNFEYRQWSRSLSRGAKAKRRATAWSIMAP